MTDRKSLLSSSILSNMQEGVIAVGFDGFILFVNDSACTLLSRTRDELEGCRFVQCFVGDELNDQFNQLIIEAVYDRQNTHRGLVPFYTGEVTRHFHMTTSFCMNGDEKIGIVAVFQDVSEIVELRDSLKAMEKIKELNDKLEIRNKLLGETFGRYLSDEIVKQILDSPEGMSMGGKKEHLTIMMSDLRGFTALSDKMTAQNLITMLNHYLGEMTAVISSFHGTVIEFIGDGIMAIFGAPVKLENNAASAVAAAISMQNRMKKINQWNSEHGYPELQMGIGLCTGDMIVGNIGSMRHAKYGVVGSNVNLCGRIESYTTGGQIYISQNTLDESDADITVEKEVKILPKGLEKELSVFEVSAIGKPYDVCCCKTSHELEKLTRPYAVRFLIVSGKHVQDAFFEGTLIELSDKEAVLLTETELHDFDNIKICFKPDVYAKVSETTKDGRYRIVFTSDCIPIVNEIRNNK